MTDHTPDREPMILLVEDEPAIRQLMRRMLEGQGFAVLEARNGGEAVGVARRHEGAIDLLLTDVVMPGMDGFELTRALETDRPGIKVLFLSGNANYPTIRQGLEDSGRPFLLKPFTKDALALRIREVLQGLAQA